LRLAKEWTQEQLGHAASIDYKHLSAVERGAKTPSFDAIGKLAKALEVDVWQLFLPDRRLTVHMEREINSVIEGTTRFEQQDVEEFLRTLRGAVRKLDRKASAASAHS
jgi:transcriptional regulator with XRE-family HTH domain